MKTWVTALLLAYYTILSAQDSLRIQMLLPLEQLPWKAANKDTITFKTPKYKQGFFCDFEDMLQRKKIPVNFNLGNSKY